MLINKSDLESITQVKCSTPHSILGMHWIEPLKGASSKHRRIVIRAFFHEALECSVIPIERTDIAELPLTNIKGSGLYEGIVNKADSIFKYKLKVTHGDGSVEEYYDPYSFLPTLSEDTVYLFNSGQDRFVHNKLGAHTRTIEGIEGVSFSVWAPSAQRISVVGDFNYWDGRRHMMRTLGVSGLWEIFIPGARVGQQYKFELLGPSGAVFLKTDPFGKFFEAPPNNASIIYDLGAYKWNDNKWIQGRAERDWANEPCSIYEMHVGSWKRKIECSNRSLTYRELAEALIDYLKTMHYTHVEFMPLAEHPFEGSWGYQVTGFFAPTQRFGPPEDFMYLVDQLHQNGIGVILDWVPAHFPEDRFALARFDESALFEHEDPRKGKHQDWGTLIFNYSRHEVRGFLVANALSWFEHFHVDGLRVDAVASMLYLDYSRKEGDWVPNKLGGRENLEAIEFLKEVNDQVHNNYPGVLMIAEESTTYPGVSRPTDLGGLGFDFKWNMGWMHDMLNYMQKDPLYRNFEHNQLTFGMHYQYSESFMQVFSHDEVVHEKSSMLMKMPGDTISEKTHELRALYGLMWLWPGKKTLFMGSDFGQTSEWNHSQSLDWHLLEYQDHRGIQSVVRDLNKLYRSIPGIAKGDVCDQSFEWISCEDSKNSVIAFIRWGTSQSDTLIVVAHFTPIHREAYRIGVPFSGHYKELLNTDSTVYGGHGFGNKGGVHSESIQWDDRSDSIQINLPPTSVTVFRYSKTEEPSA